DFAKGRLVPDDELKQECAARRPYGDWLRRQRISLADLEPSRKPKGFDPATLLPRMQAFGYTIETMQFMLLPMVVEKRDPIGSMGNDSSLACLSDTTRMLTDYFKHLAAPLRGRRHVAGHRAHLPRGGSGDRRRLSAPDPV